MVEGRVIATSWLRHANCNTKWEWQTGLLSFENCSIFFNSVLGFTGISYDIVILRISEKFSVLIGTGKNVLFFHYLWINTVQNAKANG